ncbi:MAG: molybdopterin-dependent oxidoreductase [Alphaproteobacteria bacterium]|nr:molybdopterin-dependent oxidoreductase [Alphaproteobacteria bacterium]
MSTDERQNDKLIGAKEQWARDGRALTGQASNPARGRLPPGQRLVKDFPVLDLGPQPNMLPRDWALSTAGQIDRPIKWSYDDLMAQPQVEIVSDIHCVTTWSRYDNRWKGVSAKHLLSEVQPREIHQLLRLQYRLLIYLFYLTYLRPLSFHQYEQGS